MELLRESFEGFRLSPHQRAAWRWQAAGPAHQVACVLHLEGRLEAGRLEWALRRVVERHESLRTTFRQPSWMALPLQVVEAAGAVAIVRLGPLPSGLSRDRLAADLLHRSLALPFDLTDGPMVRSYLRELSPEEHLLLLALPAVCADPWTLDRLVSELVEAYAGEEEDRDGPIQYAQYSEWQNGLLEELEAEEGREFWRAALAAAPAELPFAGARRVLGVEGPFLPRRIVVPVGGELATSLSESCDRQGIALADLLLGCWQLLLGKLSGQEKVVVRRLFDGRKLEELRDGFGLFAKYLPVAVDFDADLRLDGLFREAGRAVEQASLWQEYFTNDLLEGAGAEGAERAHAVLFDFSRRSGAREAGGIRLSVQSLYDCLEPFDLRLAAVGAAGGLDVELHFDPRRFSTVEVQRLAGWYVNLLREAARDPHARAADLDYLGEVERHQLVKEWSGVGITVAPGDLLPARFEARARLHPEAPAVSCGGQELTYGDLDIRSNRLAHHLRALGAGPEARVGVLLERSADLIVAILGILKAGGAYVPLDPGQPDRRLILILEDSQAGLVVTRESLSSRLAETKAVPVRLDSDAAAIAARPSGSPGVSLSPSGLAYVIYTSGSTGAPKGVMISHGSLAHLPAALEQAIDFGAWPLRVGVNAPISFDASVKQIVHLSRGHCLFVVPEEVRADGWELLAFAAGQRLDVLDLTPAQVRLLLEAGLEERPELREARILVGGEAIEEPLWKRLAGPAVPRFYNVYGPTECTVDVTAWRVRSSPEGPTLGRALANVQVYVLDEALRPVPAGVAGRLFVGGRGLARGYLGRPELTAEKFVPHPFPDRAGERIYDTGDLVRTLPDGRLDFLGRADHQVKVRGFRVELGEIEAVVAGHSGVREAVVLLRRLDSGDERLVAYWVGGRRGSVSAAELRDHVRQRLPEYMVPAGFVELQTMPLTRNGKIDRRALPEALPERIDPEKSAEPPRDPVEEMLAGVWTELLGVARIGPADDFFDLGGHSLLATQLVSRVRKLFRIELPLRTLFEAPRLAGLASAVTAVMREGLALAAPPIVAVPREGEVPLSFAQQRLWFLDQLQPGNPFYNVPLAARLEGGLDLDALAGSLGEIVRRHEVLRTVFPSRDGRAVQEVRPAEGFPLPLVDLSSAGDGAWPEARRRLSEEARRGFDLARGPLVRATVVRLGDADHLLLLCLHHIVSDGWSTGLLLRELAVLYRASVSGSPSPLPELPVQYADYASWQQQWLQGPAMEGQLAYWRRQLEGAAPVLDLPTDRPRPAMPSFRGRTESFRLPEALTSSLGALSRREGATLFMTLLASFQVLLSRWAGQEDVSVGVPIAGRNRLETEDLVGCFLNTLVMRGDHSGAPSFLELLGRLREASLEAHAHQDLPFEKLVEALQPERSLSHMPLFQVWFTLQNTPRERLELAGVALSALDSEGGTSKFDLNLSLVEREGGLQGGLEYSTDLFDAATIGILLRQLETLLEEVVADPSRPARSLPLLREAERRELVIDRNATRVAYGHDRSVDARIAEVALRQPAAAALVFGERTWSYGELERRVRALAGSLASRGVGPGSRVGLYLEHSLESVVAMLATLRSGAAYVPLDPGHPRSQSEHMALDSGIAVLLTQVPLAGRLDLGGVAEVYLDEESSPVWQGGAESPELGFDPNRAAYVIYTSGSTGRPKGVEISHGALLGYVDWAVAQYVRGEPVSFALYSSLSFDLTVTSIYPPLVTGNRVVVYRGAEGEPAVLEVVRRGEVEVLKLTPSHLSLLVEGDHRGRGIRRLIVGGEALTTDLARRVESSFGEEVEILNEYGPTESTVGCMLHRFDRLQDQRVGVPIGRPGANVRVYVLDADLEPVGENVAGELYIGGPGLALGYVSQPDLTAERFVSDPFVAGERMYRSGDLARWLPGGVLEYVGRRDEQVKYHGYRLELEGIRCLLNEHEPVRDSVVRLVSDGQNPPVLVAYYVSRQALEAGELRGFLQERMIEETIPSLFVHLRRLPLTLNGKVNVSALPDLQEVRGQLKRSYVAPQTVTEELLCGIWSRVLGVERVGVEESFFELGGHSLLATQVMSRVRETFGVELALRTLFETPTVSGLAERVDRAVQEGRGLSLPPIRPVPREGDLPLSFAQQRLWFLDQLQPGNPFYNVPSAVRLSGRLEVEALWASLGEIVRRHEVLRTVFPSRDGHAVQEIRPAGRFPLPLVDLSSAGAEAWPEVQRLAAAEARLPFDLARGPLVRATLVRLADADHVLLLNLHHIASDGWSIDVLGRELSALYAAAISGRPSPLPELAIQYADFAAWQRRWLSGDALEHHLAYWRRQLASVPVLELPTDHPRRVSASTRGAAVGFDLPAGLLEALLAVGRREGVTLFMTLLSAFMTLLSRYSQQKDLVVGTPVAGRDRVETEGLIGFFVNTLTVRGDLADDPPFADLLARVRETSLQAHAHQDLPFEKLVEELNPERSLSHSPLFQVAFALQNRRQGRLELPGLTIEQQAAESETAKFELLLQLAETASGLAGRVEHSTDLFDRSTIVRLVAHLETLLHGIADNPQCRLADLPLLQEAERRSLLVDWNRTAADYPRERTIHEVFERQATRTPDCVALSYLGGEVTYRELDRWADGIATRLTLLGVGPDTPVGLLAHRSPDLIAGLLGILKAGGAYLPLDPAWPSGRLEGILADSGAPLVLAQDSLMELLPAQTRGVALPGAAELEDGGERPLRLGGSDLLAYVVFTSGSTGRPKGVAVTHRSVLRLVHGAAYARFGPDEVFLQYAPIAFDASTFEVWGCLLHGGRLAIAPPHALTLSELGETLRSEGVTTLWLTAGLFHQMVNDNLEGLSGLRQLLAGGDVLSVPHVRRVLEHLPGCRLIDGYGPTESTTFTTCYDITACGLGEGTVPIGRPIANTRVYVTGAAGELVPAGVPGELWIGGDGLARGYLNRPELTAERFVPDPFGESGGRLYRTGDLIRYRAGGVLEFLGRIDHQVKLRGFRIELEEVEAVLAGHPEVRAAAVVVREIAGDKRLVAYVAAEPGLVPALRGYLRESLPDYMIPAGFVALPVLPLSANGKVDREALPEPEWSEEREADFVAPRTATQRELAAIWEQVLGVDGVGLHDDFFELGGHSLLATQVVSRIRETFSVELPLRALFEELTVAGLAERVEEELAQGRALSLPPVRPVPREEDLPLSFAQQRLWFLDQLQPGNPFYNVPSAVRLSGRLEVGALWASLGEIVRRHEVLRTAFPSREGRPLQGIRPAGAFPLPLADLSAAGSGAWPEAQRLAAAEARRPFDLARGPLVRATLVRLADTDHVLLLNLHHIVSDGWSIGLLVREFGALYRALTAGLPSPLPELPVQYVDYASWQQQWLQGQAMDAQLAFWRRQLEGALPVLDLPTDRPRPAMPSFRGQVEPFRVPDAVAAELSALSRREGATLFMTLLASFQVLLARWAGQEDVSVGTPIAGRNRLEIENLIGCFLNTLVLRGDLSGNPSFSELLGRIREAALEAHAHQDLPFEKLVEALQPERSLSHMPLFQVWFTLQNTPREQLELAGVALSALESDSETSKFDLNLSMVEREGGLQGGLEYSTDLFDAVTMGILLRQLETLLGEVVADPSRPARSLPLLREAERQELVIERNATRVAYGHDRSVDARIAEMARRQPEAAALVLGERTWSYGELERRVRALAGSLASRGVGPGSRVGLYLEHSLESVAAMLATLRSGAAYVPLDPGHPRSQSEHMALDSGIAVLLTQVPLAGRLDLGGVAEVYLDEESSPVWQGGAESPELGFDPNRAAYVIYTSGSTGRPKGVEISHGALLGYVDWAVAQYVRGEPVSFALYSSLSFDLTVTSIYPPLVTGNRVLVYRAVEGEPVVLEVVRRGEVEVLKLTPSHLSLLVEGDHRGSGIRRLIVGGEALTTDLARRVESSFGEEVEILNEYGPTEATVGCMLHRFDRLRDQRVGVPIGRPGSNVRVYVLDADLEPVGENVAGELYIGGPGLALGYVNQPGLTAERFVSDPFVSGERMYRSGDLARWLPGGVLEYVGRRDEQVKYHGYRLELEGIRCLLNEHEQVRDSVVRLVSDGQNPPVLVAYYVSRQALEAGELRRFLQDRMIEETIPNLFVHLRRLPLTLNGKVNVSALPDLQEVRGQLKRSYVAPRTVTEELLCGIWSRVLGVDRVGVEESFFELGGHSLLATQVMSRVRETFGVELALRTLFETPTVSGLAERVDRAVQEGRGLSLPPIRPVPREGDLPLSFAQQRLWFLDQLQPGNPFYNVPSAVRLSGRLEAGALWASLGEIVRRHEVLRTVFPSRDGHAVQEIRPAGGFPLPLVDLSSAGAEAWPEVQRLAAAEARLSFALTRGPLVRATLVRLADADHVLLLSLHHIVSDAWSIGLLVLELGTLYRALSAGQRLPLPELPVQYADYAAWQRQWLQGEAMDGQLAFWRRQLEGAAPVLDLPTDRPRPVMPSFRGEVEPFRVPDALASALSAFSRREGATLFMTLLASFQVLLARWAGQEDVSVGTPIAGRNRLETENLIGCFLNTLVLRSDHSGAPSFLELLGRLREISLEAHAHQDLPFEKLVEALQPERSLSHMPLFQVWFTLQNTPGERLELPGLALAALETSSETSKFDLNLSLVEREGGLQGGLEYSTDLFDAVTMGILLRQLETLLGEAVADPSRPARSLPLLQEVERQELVIERNATRVAYGHDRSVDARIAEVARRQPEAAALVFGERTWSYGELERRVRALAGSLASRGVGPGSRVGLYLEHSLESVAAMLATLRSGAAYVPLDPGHPRSQSEHMARDSGIAVLLTQGPLAGLLELGSVPEICLDEESSLVWQELPEASELGYDPARAAYVIYTSGSTGRPKGVEISHGALLGYVDWAVAQYVRGEPVSFALYSSLSFDLTVTSIYPPLVTGNRVLVYRAVEGEPVVLEVVGRGEVEVLKLTPSHLSLLVEGDHRESGIRRLIVGGEALTTDLARRVESSFGEAVEILNEYGPTEATVGCMLHRFDRLRDQRVGVPIGRPGSNVRVYVLDADLEPVGENVAGELYIGGPGLALGYVNQPDLTAERFVSDPFVPGERMYRSGDLARWLPGGVLEYVGRRDEQVKYHGYRLELEGIRCLLNEHEPVRDSVVRLVSDGQNPPVLVAYYVSRQALEAGELRGFLQERMIEETIPNLFVHLRRLPLTLNGKVNVSALPDLQEVRGQLKRSYVAPQTVTEELLCGIWSRVLGVERVGVEESFFELGGHSLLATQVMSRVRETFGVELALRTLFETPTVSGLAARVDRAVLEGRGLSLPPIRPVPREGDLPLSFAQQRLWFLDQLQPGNPFYNVPAAVRLSGRLEVGALWASLGEIVRRHEVLRTVFPSRDGHAVQEIRPAGGFPLPLVDLSSAGAGAWPEAQRLIAEDTGRSFDMARGPLVRALLVRLAGTDHVLLLNQHHIVSDAWSTGLLVRELTALYEAALSGQPSSLPELAIQYADYAAWQRKWLEGEVLEAHLAYWKRQLGDASPVLDLPTDRPRPALPSFRGRVAPLRLPQGLSSSLSSLSRREGATVFMTFLASFQALLSRWAGQEDFNVGTPIAGRNHLETEKLIGFFINTLVLRGDLKGNPNFLELLGRVREASLEAHTHQELPFEKLVEALQPDRSLSHTPLFQVWFTLQNVAQERLELRGLEMAGVPAGGTTSKFDLNLSVREVEGGLQGGLEYSTDLFDAATIGILLRQLETLLEEVVADPSRPARSLPLLREAERRELVIDRNATRVAYGHDRSVDTRIAEVARRQPEAAALVFGERTWSYGELERRVRALAGTLASRGVGPGSRVGLYLEHSLESVAAMLATLRSGAAYVPLDPGHPRSQSEHMARDSGIAVLLTQGPLAGLLELGSVPEICLDEESSLVWQELPEASELGYDPARAAYVIYTSGSTGRPKGVEISHGALLGYVDWAVGQYVRGESLSFALYSSLSFDLTVTSIYPPLVTGNRVLVYRAVEGEPVVLEVVRRGEVEVLKLTPSHLSLLVEEDHRESGIRRLIVGGEALTTDLARRVESSFGEAVEILNEYGPTESTVGCMLHRFDRLRDHRVGVPIGRPGSNVRLYVLDADLEPVGENVAGELYIGGPGLALGYVNQPDLTAERFVSDPFVAGERMYRSGDLARWLPGGVLEYVGRRDEQVKYHGYRLELEGIRCLLNEHEPVRDSVVRLVRDGQGEPVLVAHYVSRQALDSGDLRRFLQERMIEETIPSLFVHLRRLPLTLNGKVNVSALPDLQEVRGQLKRSYVAPHTSTEELLCGIWSRVLGVERVGVEESFFELGGHSLLATQVMSRVRETFGVELALRTLFETPTVSGLAARVDRAALEGRGLSLPPIRPVPREGDLPLSFAQQRLWFLDQLQPGNPFYNVPSAVRLSGRLEVGALWTSLGEIVRRHEVLRTVFPSRDGRAVQEIRPAGGFPLPLVDLSTAGAEAWPEAQRLAAAEAWRPFDLEHGPLVRATLVRLAGADHVLLLNLHHIVSDAWSTGLVIRELTALYEVALSGRASPLPELAVQYADYAAWQRNCLEGEVLEAHLAYWKRQLGDASLLLDLPTDRPRPALPSFRGRVAPLRLPQGLSSSLSSLSRREGATLFMTLLASFQTLLSRWAGQEDFNMGTPIAGRNHLETERLIGFFVNTLVLRSDLKGAPTFLELLRRVREASLEAHTHQELPFEKLVEALQPERSLSHTPLFQVWFTLQNVAQERLELRGLEMSGVPAAGETSKFDLNLSVTEIKGELVGGLEYSTDLFDAATIGILLWQLETLLEEVVADPSRPARSLPLLREAERRELVIDRNATRVAYGHDRSVDARIAEVALQQPAAAALVFGERTWSYGELERRVRALAGSLASRGVGPGSRVGLYLEHSLESVAAMLATLRSGAAYVPLDPGHPRSQSEHMALDSGIAVLLTQVPLAGRLDLGGVAEVYLDEESSPVWQGGAESPELGFDPNRAAYVIYTSGSTGRPKGVEISHGSLLSYVDWAVAQYVRGEPVSFALYSSLSFDLTVTSIYPPLVTGNRVVVYRGVEGEPAVLEVVRRGEVEVLKLTPSHLSLLVEGDHRGSGIRRLIVGGEALTTDLARRVESSFGEAVEILNEYGPTEATVGCMLHRFDRLRDHRVGVPIGRPGSNVRLYVLDADLEPVGENVAGELYIGGPGLALGYVNQPDLTAERFVSDPFVSGERMYRSGDLARWLPGGALEYVGRRDEQVKYHGYRLELEGIRCLLNEHEPVRDSVVRLVRDGQGEPVLVAYYVSHRELEAGDLRGFLQDRMIKETIPNLFLHLRHLPLTLNGKVDVSALPGLDQARGPGKPGFVAPRTATEELLCGIWARVLGVDRVGVEESFFELGGHSLLATQVMSRVRETFGVRLPLRSLFETPTVSGLAERVDRAVLEGRGLSLPPIRLVPREGDLPLSFVQQDLWQAGAIPVSVVVRLRGFLDTGVLEASFAEVARRQEALRTSISWNGDMAVQTIHPAVGWPLPVIDLSPPGVDDQVQRVAEDLAGRPFVLEEAPLFRTSLLRLAPEEHVLVVAAHPVVCDGWSLRVVLLRDLLAVYSAFLEGSPSPLPELSVQSADFAAWQHRSLEGRLDTELSYWRGVLDGAPGPLALPGSRPRPSVSHVQKRTAARLVPEPLARSLRWLSSEERATLFMTLLAALNVLVHHGTADSDIVIGTEVSNRDRVELQDLVGVFLQPLALRTRFAGTLSFRGLLRQVRETTLDAYLHRDFPFGRLSEALGGGPESQPLFRVKLVLHKIPALPRPESGLAVDSVSWSTAGATVDLQFSFEDGEQGLTWTACYDPGLYEVAMIDRLSSRFEVLLEIVAANPDARIDEIGERLGSEEGSKEQELRLEEARSSLFKGIRRRPAAP